MKSNAKFFSGLGLGLLISFIFLNVNMLKSEKPIDSATPVVQNATTEEMRPTVQWWLLLMQKHLFLLTSHIRLLQEPKWLQKVCDRPQSVKRHSRNEQ